MKKAYDVSIILVNYNGKRYIDVLMDGLCALKHSDFEYEVIFVDNASTDNSVKYLENKQYEKYINLSIVKSKSNLGFAGGNNLGVKNASGKYIVLLNNDTRPEYDWLENLYHYIKDKPDIVMANSKLVFFYDFIKLRFYTHDKIFISKEIKINGKEYKIDNKFCKNILYEPKQIVCFGHSEINIPLLDGKNKSCSISLNVINAVDTDRVILGDVNKELISGSMAEIFADEQYVEKNAFTVIQNAGSGINENYDGYDIGFCQTNGEDFNHEYEITNGCGASIIMKKDDFENCGGFDERFFMYYEDTDLSFRIKRNGRKIMYCPYSVVRHIHAGSSKEWSPFFTYHVYRNKLFFIAKNFGKKLYVKYFIKQIKAGIRDKDKNKLKGTLDSLKILL